MIETTSLPSVGRDSASIMDEQHSLAAATNSAQSPTSPANKSAAPHRKDSPPKEYSVLIVGTHHKQALFEKLLTSAEKYEKHIRYQDTFYLSYTLDGEEPVVVALNDPGTDHTGAREMAIRKAEAVILCYAAYNPASFHRLSDLVNDFKARKDQIYPPVLLLCNEDCVLEENSEEHSPASEGYTSLDESEDFANRKVSMDVIRKNQEECTPITQEQGEAMAQLFGPECRFMSMSFSNYGAASQLMEDLIRRIREKRVVSGRKERSSGSLLMHTIKRRRSIPHPLKIFSTHHTQRGGKKMESAKKKEKCQSKKKNADRNNSSSSSSESTFSTTPTHLNVESGDGAFLGEISAPPRRWKSMNVHDANNDETTMSSTAESTHFPVSLSGNSKSKCKERGKAAVNGKFVARPVSMIPPASRTEIWENNGEFVVNPHDDHFHSSSRASPAQDDESPRRQSPISAPPQLAANSRSSTPSLHRLTIGTESHHPVSEGGSPGAFRFENGLSTADCGSNKSEPAIHTTEVDSQEKMMKNKWAFRRVNQQAKSTACVIS